MKSRKNLLKKSQLYLILDKPTLGRRSLKKIFDQKIGLIQIRDKLSAKLDILEFALGLVKQLSGTKTLLIINDHVDIALACGANGVHLGQDDFSLKQARELLGQDKIIGVSCHSLAQAIQAQKQGADYIGIGPIYPTPTKPEYQAIGLGVLRQLKGKIKIPYFAIGDIGPDNLREVIASGARRIAVCRAILKAHNPKQAVGKLFKELS